MNFLSKCVLKFTLLVWIKFEREKKERKFFFFKTDILKKALKNQKVEKTIL